MQGFKSEIRFKYGRRFTIVTWNMHDLGDGDMVRMLKNWISTIGSNTQVLGLQELKAWEQRLEFNLRQLIPGAKCLVDYSQTDREGAAFMIHPSLQAEREGIRDNGSCAWAKITTSNGASGSAHAWLDGWELAQDPTEAWKIAWGKVRAVFQSLQRGREVGAQTAKSLEDIIRDMARNKATGEDRTSVEVLATLWPHIKEKCMLFFINFWETQRLGR
ncbi:hypothetical protein R1sor_024852 [Riccia sorocarpa]|uniref:Endonuclease/exonuclease/phosphatase domain-containing protein n=1 Tax=Riccia sorocarpa TaxID=122646 RepID=A0ABD3GVS5_9MARC